MAKLIEIEAAQFKYETVDGNEQRIVYDTKTVYINPDKIIDVTPAGKEWLISFEVAGQDQGHYVTAKEWALIEPLLVDPSHQAPPIPVDVLKAWKEFDDAAIEFEMCHEDNKPASFLKFQQSSAMFLTRFGDFVSDNTFYRLTDKRFRELDIIEKSL